MVKACIFDLDGTLLNTIYALSYCISLTMREFGGKDIDEAHTKLFVGDGYKELVKNTPEYGIITKEEYKLAAKHPVIIHFAGDERPWNKGCLNYYKKAYDKYAALSVWEDKRVSGKRIYMFFYHLMNLSTVFIPSLRRRISRMYLENIGKR